MKFFLVFAIIAAMAFTSCSNVDEIIGASDGIVRINGTIGNTGVPGTRATIGNAGDGYFESGDEWGLYATPGGAGVMLDNHLYEVGKTSLYWNDLSEAAPVTFFAYYPYDAAGIPDPQAYMFDATNAPDADLLIASPVTKNKGENVGLSFTHAMHRLNVGLDGTADMGNILDAEIRLLNMKTTAKVDLTTGTVDATGATGTGNYSMQKGTGLWYVAPQNLTAGGDWIEVQLGGKTYIYKVPANLTVLESGKQVTIQLTLKKNGDVTGASYAVGDYWPDATNPEGIVFWVEPGSSGAHGKVVGLGETYVANWGPEKDEEAAGVTGIRSLTDGTTATRSMIAAYKDSPAFATDYPAFHYVYHTVNGGNENGVWYLPACDELKMLLAGYSGKVYESITGWLGATYAMPGYESEECIAARAAFNVKLAAKGGMPIGGSGNGVISLWYLSSSEVTEKYYYSLGVGGGYFSYDIKAYDGNIRWIREY